MRRLAALALVCALCGCAPTLKAESERGGVVEYTSSTGAALKTAEAACQKHGRHARVSSNTVLLGTLTYDCVE